MLWALFLLDMYTLFYTFLFHWPVFDMTCWYTQEWENLITLMYSLRWLCWVYHLFVLFLVFSHLSRYHIWLLWAFLQWQVVCGLCFTFVEVLLLSVSDVVCSSGDQSVSCQQGIVNVSVSLGPTSTDVKHLGSGEYDKGKIRPQCSFIYVCSIGIPAQHMQEKVILFVSTVSLSLPFPAVDSFFL